VWCSQAKRRTLGLLGLPPQDLECLIEDPGAAQLHVTSWGLKPETLKARYLTDQAQYVQQGQQQYQLKAQGPAIQGTTDRQCALPTAHTAQAIKVEGHCDSGGVGVLVGQQQVGGAAVASSPPGGLSQLHGSASAPVEVEEQAGSVCGVLVKAEEGEEGEDAEEERGAARAAAGRWKRVVGIRATGGV
jgi:hypothetical protein